MKSGKRCIKLTANNTELFEFEFMDRQKEQDVLQNFLCDFSSSVLWIYGKSGTGKSFFVYNCISQHKVYIENKKNTEAGNCILNLIQELQKLSKKTFWDFLHNHFKTIKCIAQDIPAVKKLTESNFLQYALSKNFYMVDQTNQFNDLATILQEYINHIFNEASLVFIIDNFDQCDEGSVDVLLNFAKYNIQNKNRKFIFITTDQENGLAKNETRLEKELPCRNLPISIIPNENYFINMLPTAFDISNLEPVDIHRIYEVCHGLPEKLQDLLMNLNKVNAIEYSGATISFNLSIMEKFILSNNISDLRIDSFTLIEQCLLLVVICIGIPLRTDLLIMLAQELYNSLFYLPISQESFEIALQEMFPKPLKMIFDNSRSEIFTDHDLTFGAALLYFKENNMYMMACDIIYHYLKTTMPASFVTGFSEAGQKELLANLAYNAKSSGWETLNLECGNFFYYIQNYMQATKYFNRLLKSLESASGNDKLHFAIANYEVGLYKNANDVLSAISETYITESYIYCIYSGKILNMNNHHKQAAKNFEKAVTLAGENIDEQMYANYMLHIILTQIPNRWNDAKKIYKSLIQFIKKAYENHNDTLFYQPSNAKILKCCYNFFFNEDAINLMEMAENIAKHFEMVVEQAFILNNKGFEYIRQNDNKSGMDNFKSAYDILIKTKQHEAAYALNNIGICHMFEGNYSGAILSFKEALLYQKSYYVQLTAKTMLMQCYFFTHNKKHELLAKELENWINEHINEDPAIIRKICMNLSIYSRHNQMVLHAKYYLGKIADIVMGTSSEYRALKLEKELYDQDIDLEKAFVFSDFKELLFEPWFITLSHD